MKEEMKEGTQTYYITHMRIYVAGNMAITSFHPNPSHPTSHLNGGVVVGGWGIAAKLIRNNCGWRK